MKTILNTSILASAGTGKTFQLSDRIIALLASGQVKHDEIAALTFTRAAAAEFIIKVVAKLKDAASDEKKHRALCERLGLSPEKYTQKHFCEMLRQALYASNRVTMGTLDSFFAKLVNHFPLEVGLNNGSAKTIPDQEADDIRIRVLQQVMQDRDNAETLFNNLREYKDKDDVTNPMESLAKMVKDYHGLFIMADDEAIWGNAQRIFSQSKPCWHGYAKKGNVEANLSLIQAYLDNLTPSKKGGKTPAPPKKFETLISLSKSDSVTNSEVEEVVEFFDTILRTPEGQISSYEYYNKDREVSAEVAQAIRELVFRAVDILINARSKQTRALYQCLALYEKTYDAEIRRLGLLGFSDYVTLLTKAEPLQREEMEFRLDCSIKHWLLDEFQDTSTLQYEVLRRNIDEIVANAPEDRSVFVVGDLKQSLYEWRSGNRKLLNNLNEAIKRNGLSIPLNETFRCSPAVLAMVNAVLDKHDERQLGRFYSELAATAWSQNFQEQKAVSQKKGESLWVRLQKPEDSEITELEAESIWIAEHLKATPGLLTEKINGSQRLQSGITCAILVSKNSIAAKITEVLRQNGIEATDESKSTVINDNPVTAGILALIQSTIHPDNGLARGTAEISPASKHIIQSLGGWSGSCQKIAQWFSEKGAEGLINELIQLISAEVNHSFLRKRLNQLRALAVSYDNKGERHLADFAHFIETTESRDSADRQTVQVITIHRSKGLEYDIVYLPCLNDNRQKISTLRASDLLFKQVSEDNFTPQWLLANPGDEVCLLHRELAEASARAKAENAYGSLCRLYVGMTRAKHRLVMMSRTISDKSLEFDKNLGKHDFACLLESTLRDQERRSMNFPNTWEAELIWASPMNTETWIKDRLQEEQEKENRLKLAETPSLPVVRFNPLAQIEKLRPSQSGDEKSFSWKPGVDKLSGKALGSLVHSLFECHTTDTTEFLKEIKAKAAKKKHNPLYALAVKLITQCVASPAVADLLDKRSPETVVWREQKAALIHEGKMIDAVFDRVHIVPGKEAVIIDYKTNDCDEAELREIYAGQMALYRISVAELCGIPHENIRCILIHVRHGTLVEI